MIRLSAVTEQAATAAPVAPSAAAQTPEPTALPVNRGNGEAGGPGAVIIEWTSWAGKPSPVGRRQASVVFATAIGGYSADNVTN
jgi:hypothetical protein